MGYNLETRWTPSETQTPPPKRESRLEKQPLGICKKGGGLGRRLAGFQLPLDYPPPTHTLSGSWTEKNQLIH